MKKDTEEFIKSCEACQEVKTLGGRTVAPLVPIKTSRPFQMVSTDFMGPFTKSIRGNMFGLLIIAKFTKYLEAYAVPDVTTENFVWGHREFICRHSIPEKILSDQGSAYKSKVTEQLCELLDIEKIRTSPFHPQGNGQSENSNRTIVQLFRTYIDDVKKTRKWDDYHSLFTFALRQSMAGNRGSHLTFLSKHPRAS